jgi:hypothetical protein
MNVGSMAGKSKPPPVKCGWAEKIDRQTTLCRPDIDDCAILAPRKFLGEGLRG